MRRLKLSLLMVLAAVNFMLMGQETGHYYLMSYFKNNYPQTGDMSGGFFALSTDGLNWTELNDGAPTIPGSWIGEKLMRDPFIYFDKANMMFRLVYTTGWTMKCMGYMQIPITDGKDFKNFQSWDVLDDQNHRQIPVYVSDSIPGSICTWAPEILWDDIQNKYMVYWSTDCGSGKRAYYILTSDFKKFTNPVKFFDPGFTEIDGDLLKVADNKYYFFFKDEQDESRQIFYVTGTNPQGKDAQGRDGNGWSAISASSVNTLQGVEGPSTIKIGDQYRIYFDPYSTRINYRLVVSTDLQTWKDGGTVKAGGSNFVWSHCNVTEIPKNIYDWILTSKLSVLNRIPKLVAPRAGGNGPLEPGIYSLLGKRCAPVYSWSRQSALALPAGFYLLVNKEKRTGTLVQPSK
jgi:hypothetical protein